jgi:Small-conductance mechanosensitive channel
MWEVQTLTLAAGSSIACAIAFPALDPGDIIGLLGLGSVAISFAFQEIFTNFLAGILLLLHESFLLGDRIFVEGFEGTVEKISMRSTQILTARGERVIVPNAIVFRACWISYAKPKAGSMGNSSRVKEMFWQQRVAPLIIFDDRQPKNKCCFPRTA